MHTLKKACFVLLIALAGIITSCDNTVNINDDYKEITIVYGLLDHSETTHYIKVTKAFLSESNIYLAAKDPEMSQYGVNDLDVWIEVTNPGPNTPAIIYFDTCLIKNKESGLFYSPEQIVYKSPDNTVLSNTSTYKLYIKNLKTGKLIDAETNLIGSMFSVKPRENSPSLGLTAPLTSDLEWSNGENALIYDVSFRFFYTEINAANDTSSHYVDWVQARVRGTDTKGGVHLKSGYFGPNFYSYLKSSIELPAAGMVRYSDSVHLVLYAGNEDLAIYMDVNAPSTSIVQERPQYTNVTNGLGIFAARHRYVKTYSSLAKFSLDTLYKGQHTRHLGFVSRPF